MGDNIDIDYLEMITRLQRQVNDLKSQVNTLQEEKRIALRNAQELVERPPEFLLVPAMLELTLQSPSRTETVTAAGVLVFARKHD